MKKALISPSNNFTPTPAPDLTIKFLLRKSSSSPFGIPTASVSWTGTYEKPGFTRNGIRLYYLLIGNIALIAAPQKGMIVYDLNVNCVKYYNGTVWKCIATQ